MASVQGEARKAVAGERRLRPLTPVAVLRALRSRENQFVRIQGLQVVGVPRFNRKPTQQLRVFTGTTLGPIHQNGSIRTPSTTEEAFQNSPSSRECFVHELGHDRMFSMPGQKYGRAGFGFSTAFVVSVHSVRKEGTRNFGHHSVASWARRGQRTYSETPAHVMRTRKSDV